jgi:hypothetical protein
MTEKTVDEVLDEATRMLLAGKTPVLQRLREQYKAANTEIERSETGLFVHFDVPDDVEPARTEERRIIRGVYATMDCLQHGMDFMIFVDDGKLSMLEGYTHQEAFPADMQTVSGVDLEYSEDNSYDE